MQDKLHVLPLFSFVCHPCKFDLSKEQEKIIIDVANNIEYNDNHKKNHIRTKTIHLFQDVPELSFLGNMILDQFYKFKDTVLNKRKHKTPKLGHFLEKMFLTLSNYVIPD